MVRVGDRVKDIISGFTGIVYARTEYAFGCVRIQVAPESVTKEGKVADTVCFDEDQVKVIRSAALSTIAPKSRPTTGGPGLETTRNRETAR